MESTKAMRERARELATPPRDDFDRAVLYILDDFDKMRASLKSVVGDVEEYERINNLAPNPGRKHCWDSIAHAHVILAEDGAK